MPLLLRLGVKEAVQFDRDIVDETNLNRLHGARRSDVEAEMLKTAIHSRTVSEAELGMTLVTIDAWAGEPATWDALKACDVIFCCTDDHAGRMFLNRFARFYGIPVIDVGLAMQRRSDTACDLFARVSTLVPGHPCLLCGGYIDARRAREEALKRTDPVGYEKLKAEAYVLGEGNPVAGGRDIHDRGVRDGGKRIGWQALLDLLGKAGCCRHGCDGFTRATNADPSLSPEVSVPAALCPRPWGALTSNRFWTR